MEQTNTIHSEVEVFEFPSKEVQTDHYEILVLITKFETEQDATVIFDSIKQTIESFNGTVTSEEHIGNQNLAYTIAGTRNGIYFGAEFDLEKSQLAELNEKLRIRKDIARFLITKKRIPTAQELADEERIQKKIDGRRQAKLQSQAVAVDVEERAAAASAVQKKSEKPAPAVAPFESTPAKPFAAEVKEEKAAPAPAVVTPAETSTEEPAAKKKSLAEIDKEIDKLLSDDIDV